MLYSEFQKWLKENCPLGLDEFDFLEFCAMIGCLNIQKAKIEEGITVDELIERLFDKPKQVQ